MSGEDKKLPFGLFQGSDTDQIERRRIEELVEKFDMREKSSVFDDWVKGKYCVGVEEIVPEGEIQTITSPEPMFPGKKIKPKKTRVRPNLEEELSLKTEVKELEAITSSINIRDYGRTEKLIGKYVKHFPSSNFFESQKQVIGFFNAVFSYIDKNKKSLVQVYVAMDKPIKVPGFKKLLYHVGGYDEYHKKSLYIFALEITPKVKTDKGRKFIKKEGQTIYLKRGGEVSTQPDPKISRKYNPSTIYVRQREKLTHTVFRKR